MPNLNQEILIECDASGMGIGVVLSQEGRPIAYYSKALTNRALAMSTYNLRNK